MDQKLNKKATVQMVLNNESFNPEQAGQQLKAEVEQAKRMKEHLEAARDRVDVDVIDEQQIFTHFEKVFFRDLEQFVIDKKKRKQ